MEDLKKILELILIENKKQTKIMEEEKIIAIEAHKMNKEQFEMNKKVMNQAYEAMSENFDD